MRIGAGSGLELLRFLEGRPRPVTPSSFALIAPGDGLLGVAVRCPACAAVSVNFVTHEHLDVPFVNDARVGVVSHVFRRMRYGPWRIRAELARRGSTRGGSISSSSPNPLDASLWPGIGGPESGADSASRVPPYL